MLAERNVLVVGEAGSGKTTALNWLEGRLRGREERVARVNALAVATSTIELLEAVAWALADELGDHPTAQRALTGPVAAPGASTQSAGLVRRVRRLRTPERVYVLLDGLMDRTMAFELFGRLRDELWALNLVWVVTVRPQDAGALRRAPADAFFGLVVDLSRLTEAETGELLEALLEPDELSRASVLLSEHTTEGGEIIRPLLRAVEEALEGNGEPTSRAERQERAASLGRSASMLLAEIEDAGHPVSARDEQLQRSLGWSRAYLQRTLAELDREGLLRSYSDSPSGQGRPRKLYEPAPVGA